MKRLNWIIALLMTLTMVLSSTIPSYAAVGQKGIVAEEWLWKESTATTWNVGKPTSFDLNKQYLVYLRVKDLEGAWSDPYIKVISTGANLPPYADFRINPNPIPLGNQPNFVDFSYDPNEATGDYVKEWRWKWSYNGVEMGTRKGFSKTAINPPTNFNQVGMWKVELQVVDSFGLVSDPFYQTVEVIPANKRPVANFEIQNGGVTITQIPKDSSISYIDLSYDEDGDPIVEWQWRYKKTTDSAWIYPNPSLPPDLSKLSIGTYQIQLRVKDFPAMNQTPLWSHDTLAEQWTQRTLQVIAGNQKPTAKLVLSPNPVVADEPLTWLDQSTDPETNLTAYEMTITQRGSEIKKQFSGSYNKPSGTSLNMTNQFIEIFETAGFEDDGAGIYDITYRVRDAKPNIYSAALWSDPQHLVLTVEDALRLDGRVEPPVAKSGQAITLKADTEGRAERVTAEVDWNQNGVIDSDERYELTPKQATSTKNNQWEKSVIIPLPTKDKRYYDIIFTAYKGAKNLQDIEQIEVKGDIFDNQLVEIFRSGH